MARKPTPAAVDFDEWLSNIHDIFMNAQLMRTFMDNEPVVEGAEEFMTSRRGRLERAAMRDLYVLIEAFGASPPRYIEELLKDDTELFKQGAPAGTRPGRREGAPSVAGPG